MIKDEKKYTFILICLVIVMCIINICMYLKLKDNQKSLEEYMYLNEETNDLEKEFYQTTSLKEITNKVTYYNVKFCVERYFNTWSAIWTDLSKEPIQAENTTNEGFYLNEYFAKKMIGILSQEYIEENELNNENIGQKYSYLEQSEVILNEILEYNMETNLTAYIVQGYTINSIGKNKQDFKIMVLIDKNTDTFCIYPTEYLKTKKINEFKVGDRIDSLNKITKIEANDYNKITHSILSDEKMAEDYFYLLRFYIKYDIEGFYNLIDEEYKNLKFKNIEEFKEYINTIYSDEWYNLERYAKTSTKEYDQYTCTDNKNNHYIIQEKAPMQYTVMLDTYTIDLPDFIQKYENASTQEKVILNIQKIVDALNNKDYRYVYSKLADEFKANYFTNEDAFVKYAKETFDVGNTIDFVQYTEATNLCTYKIILKGENKEVTKTIIMRLEEGTNFVMSFNVD